MKRLLTLVSLFGAALIALKPGWADIQLPKIFSDNMVLQRDIKVNVWGTAEPGEELQVSLADAKISTTCDDTGRWSVELEAPAVGGPYQLTVGGRDAQVVFNNILVGEVWLCAGQNNMEWPLEQGLIGKSDEQKAEYISKIVDPKLRLFTVPHAALDQPADDLAGGSPWQDCNPETIRQFSAVAYFFAKYLRENERLSDMPIGLINATYGGTSCEAWTSRAGLESVESLRPLLRHWDEDTENRGPQRPAALFNGMIAPLAPFSIRGVLWYQGESNFQRGHQFSTLFPTMIKDWRTQMNQGETPFYYVQLAPFRHTQCDPRFLPELWDAQLKARRIVNTGMVVTTDIGNVQDIHPRNKEEVGRRLALIARARTYGEEELTYSGPEFSKVEFEDGKARLYFDFAEGLRPATDELQGFTICGKDQRFVPARVRIEDNTVIAWSDEIPEPIAVRYSWQDSASAYLFNKDGLPASPFRTDNFDLLSKDRNF